jgi:hypothetical protein
VKKGIFAAENRPPVPEYPITDSPSPCADVIYPLSHSGINKL